MHAATPIVLLVLLAAAASAAPSDPSPPIWPPTFTIAFNETASIPHIISGTTTGTFYYDAANSRSLTTRANGKYDRYCGSVEVLRTTPCNHLVIPSGPGGSQVRWLVFPEREYCCQCCTEAQGCGIVSPDWMRNATYVGAANVEGYAANEWDAKGLQSNYYFETAADSVPLRLDQVPDDVQDFHPPSYSTAPLPDSLFALPSYCSGKCYSSIVCDILDHSPFAPLI